MIKTVEEYFNIYLPEKIKEITKKTDGLKYIADFDIPGENGGFWRISVDVDKFTINKEKTFVAANSNFIVTIKDKDFVKLINGELSPTKAFLFGKIKIKGQKDLAMKIFKNME